MAVFLVSKKQLEGLFEKVTSSLLYFGSMIYKFKKKIKIYIVRTILYKNEQ